MAFDQLQLAREAAATQGLRERVVCYVTRGARELLVFEHTEEYPGAGVQLPAGGLEAGETPHEAAPCEAHEETGLSGLSAPVYLASFPWIHDHDGHHYRQMRHYFWMQVPGAGPSAWEHLALPEKLVYRCRYAPLSAPGLDWQLDEALPLLRDLLAKEYA